MTPTEAAVKGSPIVAQANDPFQPMHIVFEINDKQQMITKTTALPASFAAALAILIEEYSKVSNVDSALLLNMVSEAAFTYHAGCILAHHELEQFMPKADVNDTTRASFFEWMVTSAQVIQDMQTPADTNDVSKEA